MNYILDTNILLSLVRNNDFGIYIADKFDIFNIDNKVYISIASRAEILSIARQREWES